MVTPPTKTTSTSFQRANPPPLYASALKPIDKQERPPETQGPSNLTGAIEYKTQGQATRQAASHREVGPHQPCLPPPSSTNSAGSMENVNIKDCNVRLGL